MEEQDQEEDMCVDQPGGLDQAGKRERAGFDLMVGRTGVMMFGIRRSIKGGQ